MFSWLSRRSSRKPAAPTRPASFCPQVESLEDRQVPATFNLSGTVLTVNGTAASDSFTFNESTVYSGGALTTTYYFAMDDQTAAYTNAQVTQVFYLGGGGTDSASIYLNDTFTTPASSAPQQLTYSVLSCAGGGYVYDMSGNPFLIMSGIKNTYMYVGANDGATMYSTPGSIPSSFVTTGQYSYTIGNGDFHYVNGAPNVLGYAMGSGDAAYHYDGTGYNAFVASGPAYSYMAGTNNGLGQSFFNEAVGFNLNYGIAGNGYYDTATLYDTFSQDLLIATTTTTYQYGYPSSMFYYDQVQGFNKVSAYSFQGGSDFAYLYTTSNYVTIGGNYQIVIAGGPR